MMEKTETGLRPPHKYESPLCAEVGTYYFYIDDVDDPTVVNPNWNYSVARDICNKCSHITECAEWGIRHESEGMWGGLTPAERTSIRVQRRIENSNNH